MNNRKLEQNENKVLLIVMDGVGLSDNAYGNAVTAAKMPMLDKAMAENPWIKLQAHGKAVGLPSDDDMGNSEVGHNALGSGQIVAQGARLVNEAIASGKIYESKTWQDLVKTATQDATMHFIGLLSDGNVHSHIDHLESMIGRAKIEGVKSVCVHALLDGRDVPPTSGMTYIARLEEFLQKLNDGNFEGKIASGGGRMCITMDRYRADWSMVERGWQTHVLGEGRQFASASEAYKTLAEETGKLDQDLPPFVIAKEGQPVGLINDGDAVVFFNFRGDRAIEISMAFGDDDFSYFDRKRRPNVVYAGMLEYDGDLHIPAQYLVNPPVISQTLTEELIKHRLCEYAVSETQKFGHVTYFWNGNRSGYVNEQYEEYAEVKSDQVPFEQRPWMKSAEVSDLVIDAMERNEFSFIRCNYPNGDMVGHTGVYNAAVLAMEALDLGLERVLTVAKKEKYSVIITADHGNAESMYQGKYIEGVAPEAKTSHTLNPVPFVVIDDRLGKEFTLHQLPEAGLANVAATVAKLLGVEANPVWETSLVK